MAEKRICPKCKEAWCSADESKVWICDYCKAEILPLFQKKEVKPITSAEIWQMYVENETVKDFIARNEGMNIETAINEHLKELEDIYYEGISDKVKKILINYALENK